MADTPRVTVPVEPTEAMIEAAESAGMSMAGSDMSSHDMTRHVWSAMISAAPALEGGAVEGLREALIQADLKIRSLPGTDQSDVEFIREVLATREEAPAEAGERSVMVCPRCEGEGEYADGVDEAACSTPCTRCNGNGWLVDLEALRAQPPAREDAQPVAGVDVLFARAAAMRAMLDRLNVRNTNSLTDGQLAAEYQRLHAHPAPDALRVAVEAIIEQVKTGAHGSTVQALGALSNIEQIALDALQAEQKGGA